MLRILRNALGMKKRSRTREKRAQATAPPPKLTSVWKNAIPLLFLISMCGLAALAMPWYSLAARNLLYPICGIALGAVKILDAACQSGDRSRRYVKKWSHIFEHGVSTLSLIRAGLHVGLVPVKGVAFMKLVEEATAATELHRIRLIIVGAVTIGAEWQYHVCCSILFVALWLCHVPVHRVREPFARTIAPQIALWKKEASVGKCAVKIVVALPSCVAVFLPMEESVAAPAIAMMLLRVVSPLLEAVVQQSSRIGSKLPRCSRLQCGALQSLYSFMNLVVYSHGG